MAEVKLCKTLVPYQDKKTGENKTATNFYVLCGDEYVPVEVKYYGTPEKPDKMYGSRKTVLSAFAELLPALPYAKKEKGNNNPEPASRESATPQGKDNGLPF